MQLSGGGSRSVHHAPPPPPARHLPLLPQTFCFPLDRQRRRCPCEVTAHGGLRAYRCVHTFGGDALCVQILGCNPHVDRFLVAASLCMSVDLMRLRVYLCVGILCPLRGCIALEMGLVSLGLHCFLRLPCVLLGLLCFLRVTLSFSGSPMHEVFACALVATHHAALTNLGSGPAHRYHCSSQEKEDTVAHV